MSPMSPMSPTSPRRSRPEACLSDFALDRRLARDLDAVEEAAASTHLDGCARCERRFLELSRQRDEFAKAAPPLACRGASRAGSKRWSPIAGAAGLAAAAALLLLFAFRGPREIRPAPHDDEGLRAKGNIAKLGFFVNHEGSVRAGGPNERVGPGDGIRFVVTAAAPRYLAVLSVDGRRNASTYYPSGTSRDRAALVAMGTEVALPESTTLDETFGDEIIYGVFCPEPFAVEPLRRALQAVPGRPPAPEGCTVDVLHLRKEAAAPP